MNTANLPNFIHSLCLVPMDARLQNPEYILTKMLQADGSFRWKVSSNSTSCLSRIGAFVFERMSSSRRPEDLDDTRFDSIEEACSFFQYYINVQTNPEHEFYIGTNRQIDFNFIQLEFNRFLNALEINL